MCVKGPSTRNTGGVRKTDGEKKNRHADETAQAAETPCKVRDRSRDQSHADGQSIRRPRV